MKLSFRVLFCWTLVLGACASSEPTSQSVTSTEKKTVDSLVVTPPPVEKPKFLDEPVTSTSCDSPEVKAKVPTNSIYPSFDPATEQVLLPNVNRSLGHSPVEDTVLRARYRLKRKLHATLLGRVQDGQGVGISFEGTTAQLVRMGKDTTPLSPKFPIYRMERRTEIEVVLSFLGPHVIAQIFDGKTGLELLSILGHDATPLPGITKEAGATPAFLAHRAACTPTRLNDDAHPVTRYITVTKVDSATLTKTPHFKAIDEQVDNHVLETNIHGIELAYCANVAMHEVLVEAPWKYVDSDYLTYSKLPPVRADSGFRVDLSYHSPDMVNALLEAYAAEFPTRVHLEKLGTSHAGRPIYAVAIAEGIRADDTRPAIFLNGGHHGDEPLSTSIAMDAIQTLLTATDPLIERSRQELVVWVHPLINPDGAFAFLERSRFDGRKVPQDLNGDGRVDKREGVDLNRNYPVAWGTMTHPEIDEMFGKWYRGPSPASETETRAVMALADREHFVSAISFHTGTTAVLAPYTINSLTDPIPNETLQIASRLSKSMGKDANGRAFPYRKNLYEVEGTDQDWMRRKHGTAAFLIESASTSPLGYCARKDAIEPSKRAWRTLLARTLDGPFVYGYAPDHSVRFTSQTQDPSENWKTRARDGFWGRYVDPTLLKNGEVSVSLKANTNEDQIVVRITQGMTHVAP